MMYCCGFKKDLSPLDLFTVHNFNYSGKQYEEILKPHSLIIQSVMVKHNILLTHDQHLAIPKTYISLLFYVTFSVV